MSLPAKSTLHIHMVRQKLESKDHAVLLSYPRKSSSYLLDAGQKKQPSNLALMQLKIKCIHFSPSPATAQLDSSKCEDANKALPFKCEPSLLPLGPSLPA